MNILEDISNGISSKVVAKSKDDNFGSIVLTLVLIGIIVNLIRVAQECNKDKSPQACISTIKNLCDKRGWYTKMRMRKIIRQNIGLKNYKLYGKSLVESILETGNELTEEKLLQLLEASKNA